MNEKTGVKVECVTTEVDLHNGWLKIDKLDQRLIKLKGETWRS